MTTRVATLLLVLLPLSAPGRAADLTPVPPSFLKGTVLTLPEVGLALSSPATDWRWWTAPRSDEQGEDGHTTYVCRRTSTTDKFTASVFGPGWEPLTPSLAELHVAGVRNGMEKGRFATEVLELSATSLLPGRAFRYELRIVSPERRQAFVYGYLTVQDRLFVLQHITRESAEPAAFTSFVRSFKLTPEALASEGHRQARALLGSLITLCLLLSFLGLALGLLLGWLRNGRARGRVRSPAMPAFAGIALAVLAGLGWALVAVSRSGSPQVDLARLSGMAGIVFGAALFPFGIAFLVHRAYQK